MGAAIQEYWAVTEVTCAPINLIHRKALKFS